MVAVKLKGTITTNRRLLVKLPKEMMPGEVEVIVLREAPAKTARPKTRRKKHPGFGVWANRQDITDSAEYAARLRQKVEARRDGRR
ncbi:MAG TPA: hypothetical protein VJL59_05840 [Anaerolineales bacterium]|jgi:hypothetical protein|nr:hypothetical protein [Anaerolineales bacterium]